jgi:hypothetical protein
MSALGQKRTFALQNGMSALPPKADMCGAKRDVRFVPIADIESVGTPVARDRLFGPPALHQRTRAEAQGIFSPLRGSALKQTDVQLRERDRSLCSEKSLRVRRF